MGLLLQGSGISPIFPPPVSPNGWNIYHLYELISIPAIVVFLFVEIALLVIIVRFRRSRQPAGYRPPQTHGHLGLEITWTVIPALIIFTIGVLSFLELQRDFLVTANTIAPSRGPSAMEISVTGYQFGWKYHYPQGFTLNQAGSPTGNVTPLVVPTGELIRLRLTSQDVIHSWWVPAISGKTDAVPATRTTPGSRSTTPASGGASAPSCAAAATTPCRSGSRRCRPTSSRPGCSSSWPTSSPARPPPPPESRPQGRPRPSPPAAVAVSAGTAMLTVVPRPRRDRTSSRPPRPVARSRRLRSPHPGPVGPVGSKPHPSSATSRTAHPSRRRRLIRQSLARAWRATFESDSLAICTRSGA